MEVGNKLKGALKEPLLESELPAPEHVSKSAGACSRWSSLVITVMAISLGTSLQYGFASTPRKDRFPYPTYKRQRKVRQRMG